MRVLPPACIALGALIASAAANVPVEITNLGTPSQTHDHGSGLYPADKAIDGDLTTFNHTDSGGIGGAWELHFQAEQEITQIDIITRDCCSGRLNGATLRLFDAEAEMVYEIAIVDSGPLATFTATPPAGTFARDLRIGFEPDETGIVHLAEVKVFAPGGDPPVIDEFVATGKTLNWNVTGADTVEIRGLGAVPPSGSMTAAPAESTPYFLSATNACATVSASASVIVDGVPLRPRINEFVAVGDDWVEIWNPGDTPVDLDGWSLTDDPADLVRWSFPAGQSIAPGGLIVVHQPFGIAREASSYLALVDPDGAVLSEFTYPEQVEGSSYGIDLDGDAVYFLDPTPGALNFGTTTLGFLDGVDFDPPRGIRSDPFALTLSPKTPGATVLYSIDRSEPSIPYTAPLSISTTTVVRALEVLDGREPSRSEAHSYLFLNDVASQPEFPVGFPDDWLPASASGALAPIPRRSDYEMDPQIVGAAPFTDRDSAAFDIPEALASLPSMCLTLPDDQMWDPEDGLHANALKRGRAWEREASMEIIDPVSGDTFHTNCGLRIHGGRGRVAEMLKKSFRLYFRGDYGATKFDYPLFDGMPDGGVDHLVLRGGNGKTWASPWRDLTGGGNSLPRVTYLRDQFLRDCNRAMDQPSFAGTFVHLYINGVYWGLYNPIERPGGPYAANHFGGDADTDWDFLKWANGLPTQVIAGDTDAWNEVLDLSRADPVANYAAIEDRVDIDNLADFLIANFYVGNIDWAGTRNNGYAFRSRTGLPDTKFRFMCWDGEESLLSTGANSTDTNRDTTAMELHLDLRTVPEYQRRFADRAHRHLFDEDGALRPAIATARHDALADLVDRAIAAESARWGDLLRPDAPYTHGGDWFAEIANITDNYLTTRPATTLAQLRADNLYPDTAAPVAEQAGPGAFKLTATAGDIWFTLDGSDPLTSTTAQLYDSAATSTTLIDLGSQWHYLDDGSDLAGTPWQQPGFNDETWPVGGAPLGYGSITGATITTVLSYGGNSDNKHITTYFRRELEITDPGALGELELQFMSDDGAVVYFDGTELGRTNLPSGPVDADTLALVSIGGSAESTLHSLDVPAALVTQGTNTIAVELHQNRANSSDLVFDLRLVEISDGLLLGGDTRVKARAVSGGEWSALEDETFRVTDPLSSLVVSEIMYHPSDPTAAEIAAGFSDDDAFEYIEIRNVGAGDLLLDGMRFTKGIDAQLGGTLSPGGYGLIVANQAAFERRHGPGHPIIGEWQPSDRLDNGGEQIRLRSHDDTVIREFTYDDRAPWPTAPDGDGFSLVLVAPFTLPDHSLASSWRQSTAPGGTPGAHDGTTFPGGSAQDLIAYATGGIEIGTSSVTVEVNPLADDIVASLEWSTDLEIWSPTGPFTAIAPIEAGYATATFPLSSPINGRRFFRYRVELR